MNTDIFESPSPRKGLVFTFRGEPRLRLQRMSCNPAQVCSRWTLWRSACSLQWATNLDQLNKCAMTWGSSRCTARAEAVSALPPWRTCCGCWLQVAESRSDKISLHSAWWRCLR